MDGTRECRDRYARRYLRDAEHVARRGEPQAVRRSWRARPIPNPRLRCQR